MAEKTRCPWCLRSACERLYHDTEWGVPRRDDAAQFEFLILESAQAGLSWTTVLNKRAGYRKAFTDFDPVRVAAFTEQDVERLLQDPGIVRNRLKIKSAVHNARLFLEIAARHGSFSAYIWNFVDGRPVINHWTDQTQIPAVTPVAETLAKDMRRLGFRFFGPTIAYAHMQATGLVNDHLISCFRHAELA